MFWQVRQVVRTVSVAVRAMWRTGARVYGQIADTVAPPDAM